MAPDGVNNLRSSHCVSGCHVRRNSPLRLKQLCQIRPQHRPLLCHVRQRRGLSLSTEASVCAVETGPGPVICAPLTHVTVTCKNAARRRTTAARRGSCGGDVIALTELPTRPAMSPGNMTRPVRRDKRQETREDSDGEGGFEPRNEARGSCHLWFGCGLKGQRGSGLQRVPSGFLEGSISAL